MKTRTFPPGIVIAVIAAAAGLGWAAAGWLAKPPSGPTAVPDSASRAQAGKAGPKTGPAGAPPPADPTTGAAVAWLRSISILARQPRDHAAELEAGLGDQEEILRSWLATDSAACWAWFQRVGFKGAVQIKDQFIHHILTGREAEALAWLKSLPLRERGYIAYPITVAVLRLPPAEAVAFLAHYPGVFKIDPAHLPANSMEWLNAAASCKSLGSEPQGRELLSQLMEKTAPRDPAAAALWWQSQSPELQAATVAALLGAYTGGSPPWDAETMSGLVGCALENCSANSIGGILSPYLNSLAAADPVGTLKWVDEKLPVDAWNVVLGSLKMDWTTENLVRLAETLSPRMMDKVIRYRKAEENAAGEEATSSLAATLLDSAPGSTTHQLGIRFLEGMSGSSPHVQDWVKNGPADQVSPKLLGRVALDLVRTTKDPGSVLAWLETRGGGSVSLIASDIARDWYGESPDKAAAAILEMPSGPARQGAIMAAEAWLDADLPAALTWLESLPPADRPSAIQAVRKANLPSGARREILEKWGVPDTPSPPSLRPASEF